MLEQCPAWQETDEEDHFQGCVLRRGHEGQHENAYGTAFKPRRSVLYRCPTCEEISLGSEVESPFAQAARELREVMASVHSGGADHARFIGDASMAKAFEGSAQDVFEQLAARWESRARGEE